MDTEGLNNLRYHLGEMKRSTINNYIVPGLESSLIGGEDKGCVRIFEASRRQLDSITPHTHRFDFMCLVIKGWVDNILWHPATKDEGDFFEETELSYYGDIGKYDKKVIGRDFYTPSTQRFKAGETYSMTAEEMHSIVFSKDAVVLFFEGESKTDNSIIIEPVVNGKKIPTFKTEKWMFSE